jgi:uncharacterized repeat protein (TIGR02543 family)
MPHLLPCGVLNLTPQGKIEGLKAVVKKLYILLLTLILVGLAGEVWAFPRFPHTFYGTVKKDGANVPDGTIVSAWIGGVQYAYASTSTYGTDSVYAVNVPADDPDTPTKEGGVTGEIVSFKVGGQTADQTAIFSSGTRTSLNITIVSFNLAISINPSDSGSVSKNPDHLTYGNGDQVQLTATGKPGYTFSNWTGGAPNPPNSTNPIQVTVTGNTSVTANFTQDQYTLTVSVSPSGAGSVTWNPNQPTYVYGDVVTLTATENPGYRFGSWSGAASGTTNPITITMDGIKTVRANFTATPGGGLPPGPTVPYTVMTSPADQQIVVDGVSYTTPNTFNWVTGSTHTLSASSPQSGPSGTRYAFSSWSDGELQDHTITVPSASTTYTANFATQYCLTTAVNPAGAGTVSPSGTNWYDSGQSVSISVTAGSSYNFSGWSGDLTGSASTTSLTMNGPKNVTAQLIAIPEAVISCPDSGIQCLERADGGNDSDNLANGKPKVDLEYEFKVVVQDTGGIPQNLKLFMTQRSNPLVTDFYSYDMSCSGDYKRGATCTYRTMLGPAAVHKFYFEAKMLDGTTIRYPNTGYITGPVIQLLTGYNLVGIPRNINNANPDSSNAFGTSRTYGWNGTLGYYTKVTTADPVMAGEGYFAYKEADTLPEHGTYNDIQDSEYSYGLTSGWNIISNPYAGNVKLSDIMVKKGNNQPVSWTQAITNGWLVNAVYYYNGSDWGKTYKFETSDDGATLVPWMGYWIYLNSADDTYSLVFPKPGK